MCIGLPSKAMASRNRAARVLKRMASSAIWASDCCPNPYFGLSEASMKGMGRQGPTYVKSSLGRTRAFRCCSLESTSLRKNPVKILVIELYSNTLRAEVCRPLRSILWTGGRSPSTYSFGASNSRSALSSSTYTFLSLKVFYTIERAQRAS